MKYQIYSEAELLAAFRPRDRKHVDLPQGMRFPVLIEHYLSWTEPSGVRVYLIFKKPEWKSVVGVAFRRDQQGSAVSSTRMCDWCHAYGPSDQIGLVTAAMDSRKRAGVMLCLNLDCLGKMANMASLTGQSLDRMVEIHRGRMAKFCEEALQLTGQ